ncbi:unnamed protein product [Prunus armeniaca]|uniref:Uncharacterized protein n=1 Tax=Prunus armeniaca TaxID=36596 RepID=A0A6J5TK76_PRUAR|nr:unnamed protein product [Prunus armeniaca]
MNAFSGSSSSYELFLCDEVKLGSNTFVITYKDDQVTNDVPPQLVPLKMRKPCCPDMLVGKIWEFYRR